MKRFLLLISQSWLVILFSCSTAPTPSPTLKPVNTLTSIPTDIPSSSPTVIPTSTGTPTVIPQFDYWFILLDDTGNGLINNAALTPDGGLLVVGTCGQSREIWLAKISRFGLFEWQESFTGKPAGGYAVTALQDGNIALAGGLNGDGFLLYLNANGNPIWQKTYDAGGREYFGFLAATPDGRLSFGGSSERPHQSQYEGLWMGVIDLTGTLIWQHLLYRMAYPSTDTLLIDPVNLALDDSGGLDIFYFSANVYVGHPSFVEFDHEGKLVRDTVFENREYEFLPKAYWRSGNGSFVMNGSPDSLVASNGSGQPLWENRFSAISITTVIGTNDKSYVVGGSKQSETGKSSGWLMKVDQKGEIIWEKLISGTNGITKILEDTNGDLIVLAKDDTYNYQNKTKYYLVRLNPKGKIPGCNLIIEPDPSQSIKVSDPLPYPSPASHFTETPDINITSFLLEDVKTQIGQDWLCQGNP